MFATLKSKHFHSSQHPPRAPSCFGDSLKNCLFEAIFFANQFFRFNWNTDCCVMNKRTKLIFCFSSYSIYSSFQRRISWFTVLNTFLNQDNLQSTSHCHKTFSRSSYCMCSTAAISNPH